MNNFHLKPNYVHRHNYTYFDDSEFTDEWQNEVYEDALSVARSVNASTVADIGCGSAYKLLKFFRGYAFVGYDVKETVENLKCNYPHFDWRISDFSIQPEKADLVICSDVIEHVIDPDEMLKYLAAFEANRYVLSTPDRNLAYGYDHNGPPSNPTHVREWSFEEFRDYLLSRNWKILKQYISNEAQATQVAICSR